MMDIASLSATAPTCKTWKWRGKNINYPATVIRSIPLEGGTLDAIDNGEWGGRLEWSPSSGVSQTLLSDNVSALVPVGGGILALAGLAHMASNYGYVVQAKQTAMGWDVQELARLPGQFSAISAIGPDSYAAWSHRRVVIFSERGVLGLAECHQ